MYLDAGEVATLAAQRYLPCVPVYRAIALNLSFIWSISDCCDEMMFLQSSLISMS